ncbi:MAG TPA: hypothetical protein VFS05_11140 [Gemmatimonadaceae bacterium]|nr:hypothetical protein [Gemmatimonadaceae bacterium]
MPLRRVARAAIPLLAALAACTAAREAAAQRVTERHDFGDGEGKLISFYSSALTFSPVEAPAASAPWSWRAGVELSYLPRLSPEQRRVGDKPEATNLAPIFPRPRALIALPGGVSAEASWIPPVKLFDVKANVGSFALARPFAVAPALLLTPRIGATVGQVEGAITCSPDMQEEGPDLVEYYQIICNGRSSDDHFQPRLATGELVASWVRRAAVAPYAGAGVRRDWSRFDIGVTTPDGGRDPDHPILEIRATRPYLFAGATWRAAPRLGASGELFWAPGSLVTFRLQGSFHARGR